MVKALNTEKSTLRMPGPDTFGRVLEEFPYVNGAGIVKHAVLNHCDNVGFGKFGLQPETTFGRFPAPADSASGEPDMSVAMTLSCQLPSTERSHPCAFFANGRAHNPVRTILRVLSS